MTTAVATASPSAARLSRRERRESGATLACVSRGAGGLTTRAVCKLPAELRATAAGGVAKGVATAGGALVPDEVQPAGGNRMSYQAFLRGLRD